MLITEHCSKALPSPWSLILNKCHSAPLSLPLSPSDSPTQPQWLSHSATSDYHTLSQWLSHSAPVTLSLSPSHSPTQPQWLSHSVPVTLPLSPSDYPTQPHCLSHSAPVTLPLIPIDSPTQPQWLPHSAPVTLPLSLSDSSTQSQWLCHSGSVTLPLSPSDSPTQLHWLSHSTPVTLPLSPSDSHTNSQWLSWYGESHYTLTYIPLAMEGCMCHYVNLHPFSSSGTTCLCTCIFLSTKILLAIYELKASTISSIILLLTFCVANFNRTYIISLEII